MASTSATAAAADPSATTAAAAAQQMPTSTSTTATAPIDAASTSDSAAAVAGAAATSSNNNNNARLSHTTACLPVAYGSVAVYLGKRSDEYNTHKWTLYLRGPNHEDLSVCIQKVIFQLHPSFAQPVRELMQPPFEVTETGWGEFEASIRILWKDSSEKATVLTHGIKLYPPGSTATSTQATEEPVVAEQYDQVVFTDPHESFYRQLMRLSSGSSTAPKVYSQDPVVQASLGNEIYSDVEDFNRLVEAQAFLDKELAKVKERLRIVCQETDQVDSALIEMQESKKATATTRGGSAKSKGSGAGGPPAKKSKTSH